MEAKQTVALFKRVLKEAAEMFDIPEHAVNSHRFRFVNDNRVKERELAILGGFKTLRDYVALRPKAKDSASVEAMQKLLKSLGRGSR